MTTCESFTQPRSQPDHKTCQNPNLWSLMKGYFFLIIKESQGNILTDVDMVHSDHKNKIWKSYKTKYVEKASKIFFA